MMAWMPEWRWVIRSRLHFLSGLGSNKGVWWLLFCLVYVTTILRRTVQERSRISIDLRLNGSPYNIRKFQARTSISTDHILNLQYADDCAIGAQSPEALQCLNNRYLYIHRIRPYSNIRKTEALSQWSGEALLIPQCFILLERIW